MKQRLRSTPVSIVATGVLFMAWAHSPASAASDASFRLEATSTTSYTSAYLGNGFVGLQTKPLGTEAATSMLAGVYDHTPGDVPRIAAAPAWNEIDVFNGSEWLNDGNLSRVSEYRQVLDMYDGTLETSYVWSASGKRIRMHVLAFVSRDDVRAAAVRVVLTPEFRGQIRIRLPLRNRTAPPRYALAKLDKLESEQVRNQWSIWYPGRLDVMSSAAEPSAQGTLLAVLARAPGYDYEIGEAVAADWTGGATPSLSRDRDGASAELTLEADAGTSYVITKYAALLTASGTSTPDQKASAYARQLESRGWASLLEAHTAAWHHLWESDILIEGDPSLQRSIHSMLFYLLGSSGENLRISTPPMGLSDAGYFGHIFWDADTYIFPPLLLLHPEMARSMVLFRSRTRQAALDSAKSNGYQGAMYPWEAGPDGAEATPRFAGQNARSENHVNGDVAIAAWQYWLGTGDRQWLENDCWPILRDTADFWLSRVSYDAKLDRYEIGKVVAVDESLIGVSNDAYTNAVAKRNLELAAQAAKAVRGQMNPKWQEVAAKMYIPPSDSALLWFPLDLPFSPQQTMRALDKIRRTVDQGNTGAMMGTEFYPILAAQIGQRALVGKLFDPVWRPYLRPPFQVVAETPRNDNTNFITGAGAFLQQFLFGYTGLRFGRTSIEQKFAPTLPPGISQLTLKNISIHGQRQTLIFHSRQPASP